MYIHICDTYVYIYIHVYVCAFMHIYLFASHLKSFCRVFMYG